MVEIEWVAGPADHLGVLGVAHSRANLVLHLDLVAVGEDDDAGPAPILVRDHELGNDVEGLRRPAKDEGVVGFEPERATLAELVELAFDAAGQYANKGANDEDAAKGDA